MNRYSDGLGLFSLYLSWRLKEIELFIEFNYDYDLSLLET